jgi:hypothetical protein
MLLEGPNTCKCRPFVAQATSKPTRASIAPLVRRGQSNPRDYLRFGKRDATSQCQVTDFLFFRFRRRAGPTKEAWVEAMQQISKMMKAATWRRGFLGHTDTSAHRGPAVGNWQRWLESTGRLRKIRRLLTSRALGLPGLGRSEGRRWNMQASSEKTKHSKASVPIRETRDPRLQIYETPCEPRNNPPRCSRSQGTRD